MAPGPRHAFASVRSALSRGSCCSAAALAGGVNFCTGAAVQFDSGCLAAAEELPPLQMPTLAALVSTGSSAAPTLDLAALEESGRARRSPSLDGSPKARASLGDRPSFCGSMIKGGARPPQTARCATPG